MSEHDWKETRQFWYGIVVIFGPPCLIFAAVGFLLGKWFG